MKDCGTILIVDSDDASRLTAVQVAVRLGYDARPTPTADELIERLGTDRPTLAVVEVELPGPANGFEVMRQLHEAYDSELPVILVSACQTDAFDRTAGLMLGADDYVSKPLDAGELMARVKRSLRRAAPIHTNGNGNGNGTDGARRQASAHASARYSGDSPPGGRRLRSQRSSSSARRRSPRTSSTSSPSSGSTPVRKQWHSHSGAGSSSRTFARTLSHSSRRPNERGAALAASPPLIWSVLRPLA